jgi:hypothetical protein
MDPNKINSSAAGGQAQGGYNPTSGMDYLQADLRRAGSTNLMEYADTYNPSTRALAIMGARGLSGATNSAQLNEWLNYTRAGFFVKQGARASQGIMGNGPFTDLMYGAQQVMGGGGLMLGGIRGGPQTIAGGGMLTDALAKRMFDRASSYYYDDRGLANQSRTLGRSTTDISRAMQLVASSGQLAGQTAFSFGKLSTAERLRNTYADLRASGNRDEAQMILNSINRIEGGRMDEDQAMAEVQGLYGRARSGGKDTLAKSLKSSVMDTTTGFTEDPQFMKQLQQGTKSLMKLHDTMKDIFGDIKDFEALNMGSQITGISANSLNAFSKIRSGMEKIKGDAAAVGVGAAPYAQAVAGFGQMYGQAFGSQGFGGMYATQHGAGAFLSANASQRLSNKGVGRARSAEEINQENAKDASVLAREPGAVAAMQLAYQLKNNPNLGAKDKATIRSAIARYGQAGVGTDKNEATGVLMGLRQTYGGVDKSAGAILDDINGSSEGFLISDTIQGATQQSILHNYIREARTIGSSGTNKLGQGYVNNAGNILFDLDRTLGREDSLAISNLLRSGKTDEAFEQIRGADNASFFAASGVDPAKLIERIQTAAAGTAGGMRALAGGLKYLGASNAVQSAPLNSARDLQGHRNATASRLVQDAMSGDVGNKQNSMSRVLANLILSGGVAGDINNADVMRYADSSGIIGANAKFVHDANTDTLNFSEDQLQHWSKNEPFMTSMKAGNVDELRNRMAGGAGDVVQAMAAAGYSAIGTSIDGKGALAFANSDQQEVALKNLQDAGHDQYLKTLGITGVDPEIISAVRNGKEGDVTNVTGLADFREKQKSALKNYFQKGGANSKANQDNTQKLKDALYSGNATQAALAIGALGEADSDTNAVMFQRMAKDPKMGNFLNFDPEKWEDPGENWKLIQGKLSEIARHSKDGVSAQGPSAAGAPHYALLKVDVMEVTQTK